ncbi:hypothetical protein QTQ03_18745 [Micromonospora sp. WMMA1363]|uniref:hypothetical protein n=1 Tax=Micromonospora sp. WMMA1363 TaxID=3053985 RepID=UPI00259CEB05|nr:hypothetical protein [Micromonospora sp. WMMA1363]MDM4721533.1 hypothetical protein [Micromonospora sp. WMMA1363]
MSGLGAPLQARGPRVSAPHDNGIRPDAIVPCPDREAPDAGHRRTAPTCDVDLAAVVAAVRRAQSRTS